MVKNEEAGAHALSDTQPARGSTAQFDFAAAAHRRRKGAAARQLVTWTALREEFQLKTTKAHAMVNAGLLPKPYRIGKHGVRFDRDELDIAHERLRQRG